MSRAFLKITGGVVSLLMVTTAVGINEGYAASTTPQEPAVLSKVYVSIQQSMDPWNGVAKAQIVNPLGLVVFEYVPHGFKLHLLMEDGQNKVLKIYFDKPEAPNSEERSSIEESIYYATSQAYNKGNKTFHEHLQELQSLKESLLITVDANQGIGFTRTNFEANEIKLNMFAAPEGARINSVSLPSEIHSPSLLQVVSQEFLQQHANFQRAVEKKSQEFHAPKQRPIGFVHEKQPAPIACKRLL